MTVSRLNRNRLIYGLAMSAGSAKQEKPMTVAELYCILMESDTAYSKAEELCGLVGVIYPPDANDHTEIETMKVEDEANC